MYQEKDQRDHHADKNAGGYGKIHFKVSAIDHNIPGQPSGKRHLWKEMNEDSGNHKDDSGNDQKFSHLQNY